MQKVGFSLLHLAVYECSVTYRQLAWDPGLGQIVLFLFSLIEAVW